MRTDGDIASIDEEAPTPLGPLYGGLNVLTGTASLFTDLGDIFSLEVPVGLAITSVAVEISGHSGGSFAGMALELAAGAALVAMAIRR